MAAQWRLPTRSEFLELINKHHELEPLIGTVKGYQTTAENGNIYLYRQPITVCLYIRREWLLYVWFLRTRIRCNGIVIEKTVTR